MQVLNYAWPCLHLFCSHFTLSGLMSSCLFSLHFVKLPNTDRDVLDYNPTVQLTWTCCSCEHWSVLKFVDSVGMLRPSCLKTSSKINKEILLKYWTGGETVISVTRASCGSGRQLVGHSCQDVDECLWGPCLHGGSCYNLRPGFQCVCGPSHSGDHCQWTDFSSTVHPLTAPLAITALTLSIIILGLSHFHTVI